MRRKECEEMPAPYFISHLKQLCVENSCPKVGGADAFHRSMPGRQFVLLCDICDTRLSPHPSLCCSSRLLSERTIKHHMPGRLNEPICTLMSSHLTSTARSWEIVSVSGLSATAGTELPSCATRKPSNRNKIWLPLALVAVMAGALTGCASYDGGYYGDDGYYDGGYYDADIGIFGDGYYGGYYGHRGHMSRGGGWGHGGGGFGGAGHGGGFGGGHGGGGFGGGGHGGGGGGHGR